MSYQIFTRSSHIGGKPTPGSRPRRSHVVLTIDAARDFCTKENERRSAKAIRDGFHYEFASLDWYEEAFGSARHAS